jgi:hypothetical protein
LSGSSSVFLLAFFTLSVHYSFAKLKGFVVGVALADPREPEMMIHTVTGQDHPYQLLSALTFNIPDKQR